MPAVRTSTMCWLSRMSAMISASSSRLSSTLRNDVNSSCATPFAVTNCSLQRFKSMQFTVGYEASYSYPRKVDILCSKSAIIAGSSSVSRFITEYFVNDAIYSATDMDRL